MKHKKLNSFEIRAKQSIALVMVLFIAISADARTLIFQSASGDDPNPSKPVSVVSNSSPQQMTAVVDNGSVSNNVNLPNAATSELFFMLEQLQQEVNTLRGIIEEQGYELRMLKQSSRDRYVDIDSRVLDLTKRVSDLTRGSAQAPISGMPVKPSSTQAPAGSLPVKTGSQATPAKPILPAREPTKAETDAYNDAYALIKDKKFDDAILALFSYTENFPESPLLPNVYYWLGEVYLASSKLEQAKTSFSLVLTAYPDNPKASDALYKLAVTMDRLGQKSQAKQFLAEVQQKFPGSSAAKLAESYTLNP